METSLLILRFVNGFFFFRSSVQAGCMGALLVIAAVVPALTGCTRDEGAGQPNVLLISLDTLRADHLGCYGYPLPTSPFIDSLARREGAVLFENCFSQANTTTPSHMTLFTSYYPTVHGVPDHTSKSKKPRQARLKSAKTLARILKDGGFITAGVTDGGNLNPLTGLAEGFDTYICRYEGVARKVDQAIECLDRIGDQEKPFFLFLHTYQVHGPYLPPEPFRDRFTGGYAGWIRDYCFGPEADVEGKVAGFTDLFARKDEFTPEDVDYLRALYDGEIAYTDQELARLWRRLEEGRLLDDTVVILLSDHGEEFDEHDGFGHTQLYDEILHVPLICMLPVDRFEVVRGVVGDCVSLIDVMPTLLDLLGIQPPSQIQGRSLRMLWEGTATLEPWPVFAETIDFEFIRPLVTAARFQDKKLINYMQGKQYRLYDLAGDRREKTNLAREGSLEGNELLLLLEQWQRKNLEFRKKYKASFEEVDRTLDPGLLKELEQLGY